jgi:hypothetical protein
MPSLTVSWAKLVFNPSIKSIHLWALWRVIGHPKSNGRVLFKRPPASTIFRPII